MKPRVLVVDNEAGRGDAILELLAPVYECRLVRSLDEAFGAIGPAAWEVVLTNYDLGPRQSGIEFLQAMRELSPRTLRVLYCRHYCDGMVYDAGRLAGAHAVVNARLPEFPEALLEAVENLTIAPRPAAPPASAGAGEADRTWFAESASSKAFVSTLAAAATSDSPVFIHGEHGSGKNLGATLLLRWRSKWREEQQRDRGPGRGRAVEGPVAIVAVPPLRERREDIPALARHVLERHARQSGEPARHLSGDALEELMRRPWWGNVRELHGVLLRACQRAGVRLALSEADLPRDAEPPLQPSQGAKDAGQRECVLRQLRTAGNVSGAARLEGISRTNYIRLMRRLGIIRADTAAAGEPDGGEPGAPARTRELSGGV